MITSSQRASGRRWIFGKSEGAKCVEAKSDWAAFIKRFSLLQLSPCVGVLPNYISSAGYVWLGYTLLTLVFLYATIAGLVLFTWLTIVGHEDLKSSVFQEYERAPSGAHFAFLESS